MRPSSTCSSTRNDPVVIETARADGIPEDWIERRKRKPDLEDGDGMEGRLPAAPEYRTLPMVWYVPPLSPIQNAAEAGKIGHDGADAGRAQPCASRCATSPTC